MREVEDEAEGLLGWSVLEKKAAEGWKENRASEEGFGTMSGEARLKDDPVEGSSSECDRRMHGRSRSLIVEGGDPRGRLARE